MLEIALLRAATRLASLALVVLSSAACSSNDGDADDVPPPPPSSPLHKGGKTDAGVVHATDASTEDDASTSDWFTPLQNASAPLTTPTYDGSGQTVEPTVLYFPRGWGGHSYWMAVSPYPGGNAAFENPSILVSEDGLSWSVPDGLTNPLDTPADGTLADATLVHDSVTNQLWVYYLHEVDADAGPWEELLRTTSPDGIHWSPSTRVLEGELFPAESPSVMRMPQGFAMWSVEFGAKGCTTSASRVTERLSVDGVHWAQPIDLGLGIPGWVAWHINVSRVPGTSRLLAAITAFPTGTSCNHTSLFLAYTTDSGSWVAVPKALLGPGKRGAWDDYSIYRSSLLYDAEHERLRLWYSARHSGTNAWHVGYTEGSLLLPP